VRIPLGHRGISPIICRVCSSICTAILQAAPDRAAPLGRWRDAPGLLGRGANRWDAFISHAGKDADKPFATKLRQLLDKDGIGLRVFVDEKDLVVGEHTRPALERAMKSSTVAILLLSKDFFERVDTCLYELEFLIKREQRRCIKLVPVFLRLTPPECSEELKKAWPGQSLPVITHCKLPCNTIARATAAVQWFDAH
jgi:hypothetical protein